MLQIPFSLCTVSKIIYIFLSVLLALSRLVASSYTEDTYGVVQKVIKSPFVFFPIQWMPFLWWCIIYKPGYFILLALSWSQTLYNNILISLSESSKNFRLSLEFTSGESFRDFITIFDFRHSWILDPSVPSYPSVRFWIFNTSVVFWILDFGHYGSIFIGYYFPILNTSFQIWTVLSDLSFQF